MTGLRTIWGISLDKMSSDFGQKNLDYLMKHSQKFLDEKLLFIKNNVLKTTQKGKFLTDGIASDLFLLNLD